jgi:TonB family protein
MEPGPLGLFTNSRSVRPGGTSPGSAVPPERPRSVSVSGLKAGLSVPSFSLLQASGADRRRRRGAMLCSPVFEALAIGIFLWMLAVLPHVPTEPPEATMVVPLVAPPAPEPVADPKPAPIHISRRVVYQPPRIEIPRFIATRERPPVVLVRRPEMAQPPKVDPAPALPAPLPKLAVLHPKAFNLGSAAKPTVKLPIQKVQTGGFGDPQGLPGHAEGGAKGNVPKLGSFDLPEGPGQGNGAGDAHGVSGVVASAGFGNGIGDASLPAAERGAVKSSGFGNAEAGAGARRENAAADAPSFVPAVILSKPDPVYPSEARKLRIEGEVLLSVVFEASGRVRVLRVLRGLGHGMDQAAVRAAEGIAFKPARRNGHAVDSDATVHIIFQLAY